ncbi:hypothetical protein SNEBB_006203, partial [Seison nebaliae]
MKMLKKKPVIFLIFQLFLKVSSYSDTSPCNGVQCNNNSVCQKGKCQCSPGFFGTKCDIRYGRMIASNVKHNCNPSPCEHGQCISIEFSYECICTK